MRRLSILLAALCSAVMLCAQTAETPVVPVDSTLTVSLLTCSPGHQIYELYGHTAIRVRSERNHFDLAFNYGVFSFDQPHFVARFLLGKCDYLVLPCDLDVFMVEYQRRGSSVTEQVLNLTPAEATRLTQALFDNARPEHRSYRYNFLTDNCTTRARDIIEENIDGNVVYPVRNPRFTYRQLIHQFTKGHPWAEEGNDLLLGVDMDSLVSQRAEMFLPSYMQNYADSAMIRYTYGRNFRPLVRETNVLLPANTQRASADAASQPSFPLTPVQLGWALLALFVLLLVWEQWRGRIVWAVDIVLMLIQGLSGLLLTVMMLWSEHPGVASNWQVVVLNPLPLFAIYAVVKADIRRKPCLYHRWAAIVLLLFLVAVPFAKQDFSAIVVFLALYLLTRAVSHLLIEMKDER